MNHSKLSVRTLTMLALLTAMSIIFARVLTVSTGFLRFNLGALPTHLAAVWFGPAGGFAVGAVADLIGGTLSGYSINPLITLGAGSVGLVSGLLFQKLSSLRLGLRLQISILAGHLVGSVVIQWPVLAARIPNAIVLSAVNTVLVRILLENKALAAMIKAKT